MKSVQKKVALIFPGQGSQRVGMGKDIADRNPEARAVFDEASAALGYDLARLCFEGPVEQLDRTEYTQPALLATSVALYRILEQKLLQVAMMAGHSLGEYSAIVSAGGLKFTDAVILVRDRGRYMQEAVPEGTGLMAAVLGLDRETIGVVCREASSYGIVSPANYNSPGQIVIAGEKTAVEAAIRLAKEKGAKKVIPLPVSVPSHCALMEPAGRRLQESLERMVIGDLRVPLVTNVEAKPVTAGKVIRQALIRQLAHPVLWEDSIHTMIASGIEIFIEVGAGRVLSGLVKRIHREAQVWNVENSQSLKETIHGLNLAGEAA